MNDTVRELKQKILTISSDKKSGHIPSSFSVLEILYSLYFQVMKDHDEFILSKGHASLGLYSVLLEKNVITQSEFDSFCAFDSNLGGHPDRNKVKGVYASTGSLGHGLPIAVGSALAKKIRKSPGRIYCLVGDGECNEGTIWESALLASHLCLDNIVCIIDENVSQTRSVPTSELKEKFCSFLWDVYQVNGHDVNEITSILKIQSNKPLCIIAKTVKGHGIKEMEEDMFAWHHRSPDSEELKRFLSEIEV